MLAVFRVLKDGTIVGKVHDVEVRGLDSTFFYGVDYVIDLEGGQFHKSRNSIPEPDYTYAINEFVEQLGHAFLKSLPNGEKQLVVLGEDRFLDRTYSGQNWEEVLSKAWPGEGYEVG